MSHYAECITAVCGIDTQSTSHLSTMANLAARIRITEAGASQRRGRRAPGDEGILSAHQQVAVRRAFPTARIDERVIRLGRWIMVYTGEGLDLPTTAGPGGRIVDGCDEAMALWRELVDVLRGH